MRRDRPGQVALVTGGTRGLGRAIGLRLAQAGATVWLTHRWGSADEGVLRADFEAVGGPAPHIVLSDAGHAEDRHALLDAVLAEHGRLDVLVSGVCVVGRAEGLHGLSLRTLRRSLDYSAWPVEHLVEGCVARGMLPRQVVALSSDGVDHVYPSYDYVACSKAVLEQRCRALARRYPCARINALRTRLVVTQGLAEVFGPDRVAVMKAFPELHLPADEVADAAALLGSDDLPLSGRVLGVDRGARWVDNLAWSGPGLVERLSGRTLAPAATPSARERAGVRLVGQGAWTEALRTTLAAQVGDEAGGVVVSASRGSEATLADRLWPAVQALQDGDDRVVIVHDGGAEGALARTLTQHLGAHAPHARVNTVRAGEPEPTARAALALLGPALRGVRSQHLDLRRAA